MTDPTSGSASLLSLCFASLFSFPLLLSLDYIRSRKGERERRKERKRKAKRPRKKTKPNKKIRDVWRMDSWYDIEGFGIHPSLIVSYLLASSSLSLFSLPSSIPSRSRSFDLICERGIEEGHVTRIKTSEAKIATNQDVTWISTLPFFIFHFSSYV